MNTYKTESEFLKNTVLKDGPFNTTKEVFERVAKFYPNKQILAELDENKNIIYHTTTNFLNDFYNLGEGLIASGFENKHIALVAENSYKYLLTDITTAAGVGVITPVDHDANEELLTKLLNGCDADVVVCSFYLVNKLESIKQNCKFSQIVTIDKKLTNYPCIDEIIELGKTLKENAYFKNKKIDVNETCEILFTSGTTGANKGVELNQKNLVANILNCLDVIKAENKNNTSMSILPMHHATEINTHIVPRIAAARLTYISSSMKDMMNNIKIFKPYVITIVPMIANAFYKTIWQQAKKQGKEEKLKKGIKLCKILSKIGIDATHKLFKDLYAPFGGNLKQIVCGGAPLNPEVVAGLRDLGIYILNGFGITECGPLVSMNSETYNEVYSIGKACPKLEIKIDEPDENNIGELCVKGESVSSKYYKDEEGTKLVHDEDGFFHTGDLVYIDSEKRLFLAGRKKNLIVLDNGKNVFPEELEQIVVNNLPYIKDIIIYEAYCNLPSGKTKTICAGIYNQPEEIVTNEQIIEDFRKVNRQLPGYKQIRYINVVDSEYQKSATKKILRKPALERHNENDGLII